MGRVPALQSHKQEEQVTETRKRRSLWVSQAAESSIWWKL